MSPTSLRQSESNGPRPIGPGSDFLVGVPAWEGAIPKKKRPDRRFWQEFPRVWWGKEPREADVRRYLSPSPGSPASSERSRKATVPSAPLDLKELFRRVTEPEGQATTFTDSPTALLDKALKHANTHTPDPSDLLRLVRHTLPVKERPHAAQIAGLLRATRRAQLIAVCLRKSGYPPLTISATRLEIAQHELQRARWRAKDTRKRVLAKLRLAHPRLGPKKLRLLRDSNKAVLEADAVHCFACLLRDTYMEDFNAEWSGLSHPQAHVRMVEERAWVPLLVQELRYDYGLELQTIADLLADAGIVREITLDDVSKILARSQHQR